MAEKKLDKKKIQDLGLKAIQDFFEVDPSALDTEILKTVHQKAKLAMQFEREMNVGERAVEMNYLRVFNMIADDKKELKRLIKRSLPQYVR